MIIGSHCSLTAPDYFAGSVKEALSYDATALMIYTGAPQNARRTPLEKLKIEEGLQLLQEANLSSEQLIIHAPYLINLANTINPAVFESGITLLTTELQRSQALQAKVIVLHPGSHVGAGVEAGIASIIKGLDMVLADNSGVAIALETMAGKGSEVGTTFEEIQAIIAGSQYPERLKVCLDTCHIHDAGYDLTNFDDVLEQFDQIIGLDKLAVIHLNDSKNQRGAKKDRHANIGEGFIGFDCLYQIAHHPKLAKLPFILETPYIDGKPPYKAEINRLRFGD